MTQATTAIAPLSTASLMLAEASLNGDLAGMRDVHAMATALQRGAQARKLGVEAENAAAEVVLRAERVIGQYIDRLRDEGRYGRGQYTDRSAEARWGVSPEGGNTSISTSDLGLNNHQVENFGRLSKISDEDFERLLAEATGKQERIAKVNFYGTGRKPRPIDVSEAPPAQPEARTAPGFATLRAGIYSLLGWRTRDDGTSGPTDNALLRMPGDELLELADLIRSLATAYNEARAARE
jgi:hypothetical protein